MPDPVALFVRPIAVLLSTLLLAGAAQALPLAAPLARRAPTERERAKALLKQGDVQRACALLQRAAAGSPGDGAVWTELSACELRRGRRKAAVEASLQAVRVGDRSMRKAAYSQLRLLGVQLALPTAGCDWIASAPACEDRVWACSYEWSQAGSGGGTRGKAATFGQDDDEREELDRALQDETALTADLAAEASALVTQSEEEAYCGYCHAHALESTHELVTRKAEACFLARTGREETPDLPCQAGDEDCDTLQGCLQEAQALAQKSEEDKATWPEAWERIQQAHKECDKTCGTVATQRCEVIAADPCRGLVGYACQRAEKGKRPKVRIGEISLEDDSLNWSEESP